MQRLFLAELKNLRVFFPAKNRRSSPTLVSSRTKKLHYSGPNDGMSFTTSASKSRRGGAIFIFEAKIGLKSTKNVLFCILFRPMGGARAPPGYATWEDGMYNTVYSRITFFKKIISS